MLSRANTLKILSALVLFGAWEIAGRVPVSYAFPTFLDSMRSLFEMIGNGMMYEAYKETLRPLVDRDHYFGSIGHRVGPLGWIE